MYSDGPTRKELLSWAALASSLDRRKRTVEPEVGSQGGKARAGASREPFAAGDKVGVRGRAVRGRHGPEQFPPLPAFLVRPMGPHETQAVWRPGIVGAARRFLLNDLYGPLTATTLFLVAGGAAMAGAQHLQDLDIGSVLGLSKAPALQALDAFGREDVPVPLALGASAQPGTTLRPLRISGLPAGAKLSSGERLEDGDWSVSGVEVDHLVLVTPANFHGKFDLAVTASALDGDEIESRVARLTVEIEAVADVPMLEARDITGREDERQSLGLSVQVADEQESLSISILGLPPGASLSHGAAVDGEWIVDASDLDALQINPPPDFSGAFPLRVDVTAHDAGDSVLVRRVFDVSVIPVADVPVLEVDWLPAREDVPVELRIDARPSDPTEVLSLRLAGLPTGARLSAGAAQRGDVWIVAPDEAADLQLFLPPHFSGPVPLNVTATALDGNDRASAVARPNIDVAAEADRPVMQVSDVTGTEDVAIPLDVSVAVADPKQDTTVSFLDLPPDTTLSRGSPAGPGEWRLDSLEDIEGLRLTPPPDYAGVSRVEVVATSVDGDSVAEARTEMVVDVVAVADPATLTTEPVSALEDERVPLVVDLKAPTRERVTLDIAGLPADASLSAGGADGDGVWRLAADETADLVLTLPQNFTGALRLLATATTFDGDDRAVVTGPIDVDIAAVADPPSLAVTDVTGVEDQPINLDLAASSPDPAEFLAVRVAGVPAGALLSAGRESGRYWQLDPRDLAGLAFTPPPHFSGDIALDVSTVAYHGLSQAAARASFLVSVEAVADMPVVEVAPATGPEDTAIPLAISARVLDESERLSLAVANVPEGAALSRGQRRDDGAWALDREDWLDVAFLPSENFSGAVQLAVTATSIDDGDTASMTAPLDIAVEPVADRPSLTVEDAVGIEDGIVALRAQAETPDPSESLVVRVSGLPPGARLSAGEADADGSWLLDGGDLRDLSLIPPGNLSGQLDLLVSATSLDGEATSSVEETLGVTLVPVADFPSLTIASAVGRVGRPLPVEIDAVPTDEGETLAIAVRGLPEGFGLSKGENGGDGTWTLGPAELEDLAVVPPGEIVTTFELTISVSATDGSDRKQVTETLEVTFTDAVPPDQGARLSLVGSATAEEAPPPETEIAVVPAQEATPPTAANEDAAPVVLPAATEITAAAPPQPTASGPAQDVAPAGDAAAPAPEIEIVAVPPLEPVPLAPAQGIAPAGDAAAPARETEIVAVPRSEPTSPGSAQDVAPAGDAAGPAPERAAQPLAASAQAKMAARAGDYLRVGDVTAARLLYEAIAKLGDADAALRAGETYDPIFLKEKGFVGALPDPERAKNWYQAALDQGAAGAVERIERLEDWIASSSQ